LKANERFIPLLDLEPAILKLLTASTGQHTAQALQHLQALVPEFSHKHS
jgi:hypothetical protein